MEDIHRYLGEGLFLVYLIVVIVAVIMGRRGRRPPAAVIGVAHALLAVQVVLGIWMWLTDGLGIVPWYHPILGLAAILVIGLTPLFRATLRPGMDAAVLFALVAVLVLAAQLVAQTA